MTITKHPETSEEYMKYWAEIRRFLGEDLDGLKLTRITTSGERVEIDVHYGLFLWLTNAILYLDRIRGFCYNDSPAVTIVGKVLLEAEKAIGEINPNT